MMYMYLILGSMLPMGFDIYSVGAASSREVASVSVRQDLSRLEAAPTKL
jgi:hypothetical protein